MGCGKFFWGLRDRVLVVFWALFWFLYGGFGVVYFHFVVRFCMVCGAIQHGLWCGSTWSSILFGTLGGGSAGKRISEEEGAQPLMPSSTIVAPKVG